ncbi:hypothetical protein FHR84_003651 [Actinopolyspora biskrensis]|uniref:Secreted protein n=1 Tax=Actinopolyspora biskrensis TaxID=1470178 RepID=A0A852Z2R2_9ACTN|nr:hypothetical protein [Actinopolyspora biskrensis]NYH80302.1 hypothetical protein [Actinopolyspora biskrensis]
MLRNRRMFRRAVAGAAGVVALIVTPAMPAALATAPAAPQAGESSSTKGIEELAFTSSGMDFDLGNQNFVIPLTGSVVMEGTPPVVPGTTTSIEVRNLTAHSTSSAHHSSPRQDLGEVSVEQSSTPKSSLTMTQKFPPRFEQTMSLDLRISIENPPEGLREQVGPRGAQQGPLVLTTKNPAKLVGRLDQFPPRGAQYQLEDDSVELVTENDQRTLGRVLGVPVEIDVL